MYVWYVLLNSTYLFTYLLTYLSTHKRNHVCDRAWVGCRPPSLLNNYWQKTTRETQLGSRVVHGLGWPMAWVGSTAAKVLKLWRDYANAFNAFKTRLDKIWLHQAVKFVSCIVGWVGLGPNFPTYSGLGWIGSHKTDHGQVCSLHCSGSHWCRTWKDQGLLCNLSITRRLSTFPRHYTYDEVTSQSLWSRYNRHFVGIAWCNASN